MPAPCQTEINGLPILTGCPADTEVLLVMNSTAAGNNGGYGLRYVRDVRQCWLTNNLNFELEDFTIGQAGSLMNPGDTSFTVSQTNMIKDSVFITLGGPELPRNDNTQISYEVTYALNNTGFTVTFNQGAISGQQYILHYAYAT